MKNDRNLRILIVEDNAEETKALVDSADAIDGLEIIGTTNNSEDAITLIKSLLPDVIILDLELSYEGSGNGLEILYAIKETPLTLIPFILITTNNTSTQTTNIVRQLGADFIQYKHDINYSAQKVISLLHITKEQIFNKNPSTITIADTAISLNDNALTARISTELNLIGIANKHTGHKYLVDAIKLAIGNFSGIILKEVARKHHRKIGDIEHNIQYAIDAAWNKYDENNISAHYTGYTSSDRGAPTPSHLIHFYADKIRNSF